MASQETIYERAKASVRSAGEAAKERAAEFAEEQKGSVSDHLQEFARAIEKAGEELGAQNQTLAAQIVRQAGDSLGSLSRSLHDSSLSELVDSLRRFGRENPAAFIGGAVLAGLALGRFAQASGSRSGNGAHLPERSGSQDQRNMEDAAAGSARPVPNSATAPSAPAQPGSISAGAVI